MVSTAWVLHARCDPVVRTEKFCKEIRQYAASRSSNSREDAAPSSTGDALAADTTRVEALYAFDDGDDLLIYERRLAANEALHSNSSLY
jgi:hypothetical protein